MARGARTLLGALVISVAIVAAAGAGAALAGANSVNVTVPRKVTKNVLYSIKIHGFAAHSERLYLFIDYHACGRNPSVEHLGHEANGDDWIVDGRFHKTSADWKSSRVAEDHVCVYLQKASQPLNGAGGVLARGHKGYRVHA